MSAIVAALLTATPAFSADDAPAKLDRSAEIVVIGDGEMMDALQRALEDEVAIINADGGVMGWPLKVTRVNEACDANTPKDHIGKARDIAARTPILVFQWFCKGSGLQAAAAYAERNILFMGVEDWPPELTEERAAPTVFRLGRNHRHAQEIAFNATTVANKRLDLLGLRNSLNEAIAHELRQGFSATPEEKAAWGALLEPNETTIGGFAEAVFGAHESLFWKYDPKNMYGTTVLILSRDRHDRTGIFSINRLAREGWTGNAIVMHSMLPGTKKEAKGLEESLSGLPVDIKFFALNQQPFYLGPPPPGAKAYTAFHPDWVAGFWQVMKAVKFAKSLDGREIATTLGGQPFFSRAPWLMLQSQSRYTPPELRQRFNDNGDLRMAGYKLEKVWPKE